MDKLFLVLIAVTTGLKMISFDSLQTKSGETQFIYMHLGCTTHTCINVPACYPKTETHREWYGFAIPSTLYLTVVYRPQQQELLRIGANRKAAKYGVLYGKTLTFKTHNREMTTELQCECQMVLLMALLKYTPVHTCSVFI